MPLSPRLSGPKVEGAKIPPAPLASDERFLTRAYLLKEGLRYVFAVRRDDGKQALRRWLAWARRSQLPAFLDLHRKITTHRHAIEATLEHGLSNALIESTIIWSPISGVHDVADEGFGLPCRRLIWSVSAT
jgi:transposase